MVGTDGLVRAIKSDKSDDEDDGSDSRQNVRDDLDCKFDKSTKYTYRIVQLIFGWIMTSQQIWI